MTAASTVKAWQAAVKELDKLGTHPPGDEREMAGCHAVLEFSDDAEDYAQLSHSNWRKLVLDMKVRDST